MAGLMHDFLLLSRDQHPFNAYGSFINDPRALQLHDDFISASWDTLQWIPSFNPGMNETMNGLCRWGTTIIHRDGAAQAAQIFSSWASLLSAGPEVLRLRVNFTWDEDEFHWEAVKAEFDRGEVVDVLRSLAGYAERVRDDGGDLYILHHGI